MTVTIKKCPRCNVEMDESIPGALSRRDNETEICSECGTEEAMIDAGFVKPDQREKDFIKGLSR
jgi:rRNA maturation protein Nop10